MLTVDPTAAAWIREHVLPAAYRAGCTDPARCPCQYGPAVCCLRGRHEQCQRTQGWHRHGEPQPDTYITTSRGMVVPGPTAVWRVGRACRWLCPCRCHTEVMALIPPPVRGPGRSSRSGGNGVSRISSTDRLTAHDAVQSALW